MTINGVRGYYLLCWGIGYIGVGLSYIISNSETRKESFSWLPFWQNPNQWGWVFLAAGIIAIVTAWRPPDRATNRGGGMLYPEETLTALKLTRANHPHMMLEFDVRAIADGTLVLCHDATVARTAAGGVTGNVKDMTRAQWSALRIKHPAGGASAPASTLGEVMDEFGGTDVVLAPELKDYTAADKFVETLWPYRDQIFVQAGNTDIQNRLVKSGFQVLGVTSVPMTVELTPGMAGIGVPYTALDQPAVDYLHGKGLKVWAWTVDDQDRMTELFAMGVDGVMSNDPRLVIPS